MLIDTHAHLNDTRYDDEISSIIENFAKNDLSKVICVGYDRKTSDRAVDLSNEYKEVYAAVAIHPHDSKDATKEDYLHFANLSKLPKVVAYGEIGLDFFYNHSDRETQERVFVEQLQVAYDCQLPVILHVRDAFQRSYEILKSYRDLLKYSGVMHCYSGSAEMVKMYTDLGLYISFSGIVTFKNSKKKTVVEATPLDRLLIETDAPYLTPEPYRGKMNYPYYVNYVAKQIQQWLPSVNVAELTTKNAYSLFKKIRNE